jgi:hypothetical protein
MGLRDYFAAQIAASMVNAAMIGSIKELELVDFNEVMIGIPQGAYKMADAMLAQRAKKA